MVETAAQRPDGTSVPATRGGPGERPPNPALANHLGGVRAIAELAPVELAGRLRAPVEVVRDAAGTVVNVTELHVVYVPVPSTTHG